MTTLQIDLSAQLLTELSVAGVNAYAVYFDSAGTAHWTNLVIDGTGTSSASIDLPSPFSAGKVYVLVQSVDTPGLSNDLPTNITTQSQISWDSAQTYSFRYDSFEVTLSNANGDMGNLTSVNGFGMPMALSVSYSNGTSASAGYAVSATTMFNDIWASGAQPDVFRYTQGPLGPSGTGNVQMAISPTVAVGLVPTNPAFPASNWNAYIQSLETTTTPVNIAGYFNGAPDGNNIWHNAGFYNYTLSWDSINNTFWLSPNANSQIKGYIKISPTDLENSIYSTLGNVEIYTNKTDATPYEIYDSGSILMNSGANNQWGSVLAQFLTGFTAGYYGVTGTSLNPARSTEVALNNNWNWDPTYAFGSHLTGSEAPIYYDAYSKVFFLNSNSYGSGYTDALMQHYSQGSPLVSMWDAAANTDAAKITLTLFSDSETPTGYVTPTINNYIASAAGGYVVPTIQNGTSVVLNFANQGMVLDPNSTITLYIMTGTGSAPTWTAVTLTGSASEPLFQAWNLEYNSDSKTYTAQPFSPEAPQPNGNILINNLPIADNGVSWYMLEVSGNAAPKTFDLYTTTSGSQILNPAFSGQESSLAIDGLATISPQTSSASTINTFTVNFLYSTTTALDPAMLVANTQSSYLQTLTAPSFAVIGTVAEGVFTAIPGQSASATASTPLTVSANSEVAFGWAGLNDASGTRAFIKGYTNKIAALDVAHINIAGWSGPAVTATADIDGIWQTAATQFGNGTYTATMTEYLSTDTQFTTPVGRTSNPQTFTIQVDEQNLGIAARNNAMWLDPATSHGVAGNWVRLETHDAPLPAGSTLVLYATDANGALISSVDHHTGSDVTLADATLGKISSVSSDLGTILLQGAHSVYLPVGEQLHFAMLSGSGSINYSPDVQIIDPDSGRGLEAIVNGLHFSATTNNTLSDSSEMAAAQRSTGQPLVYLHAGDTLSVEVTGSAANTNTLGFVHLDVNDATGAWSVGGVAYGDTDAFHAAVSAALDAGFREQNGGGQFDNTVTWHLAGGTGFYAPVLLTQSGDMFVIGNANAGGYEYIRMYGENTFGFEDVAYNQGSDFDFNDMVMKLTPISDHVGI